MSIAPVVETQTPKTTKAEDKAAKVAQIAEDGRLTPVGRL